MVCLPSQYADYRRKYNELPRHMYGQVLEQDRMLSLATFARSPHILPSQLPIAILAFPAETQLWSQRGTLDCAALKFNVARCCS